VSRPSRRSISTIKTSAVRRSALRAMNSAGNGPVPRQGGRVRREPAVVIGRTVDGRNVVRGSCPRRRIALCASASLSMALRNLHRVDDPFEHLATSPRRGSNSLLKALQHDTASPFRLRLCRSRCARVRCLAVSRSLSSAVPARTDGIRPPMPVRAPMARGMLLFLSASRGAYELLWYQSAPQPDTVYPGQRYGGRAMPDRAAHRTDARGGA